MPPSRIVGLPDGGWLSVHEQIGEGQPFLLLHGFTDCAESFRLLLPELQNNHLIIPDLRGHGASFRGPIPSIETLAQDIEALIHTLGLQKPVVVGHSMGALVAIAIASRSRTQLGGLVTISGSLRPAGPALTRLSEEFAALPTPLSVAHPFLDTWYACERPVAPEFLARLRASCANMRRDDWLACLRALQDADYTQGASGIDIPTFVLSGDKDVIFSQTHHMALTSALKPKVGMTLSGVGHNPHWEVPSQVAALLMRIEGKHDAGQSRMIK